MSDIELLNPRRVWKFFKQINDIPRGSGNEKEISNYFVSFAKERNLWVHQDKSWNVIIKKPATKGYEQSQAVILQGHMDMVCEKVKESSHDFTKDPIKMIVDGDFVKADGTTLGADNGIAAAIGLALIDEEKISHPPIELVLTTDEESGMNGARNLDVSLLEGRRLINMDTEEEGHILTCCAGGMRGTIILPVVKKAADEGKKCFKVIISGLRGGHSGIDIGLNRANANKLMGTVLDKLISECDCDLAEVNGGTMDNAITRDAEAVVLVSDKAKIKACLEELQNGFRQEYKYSENNINVFAEEFDGVKEVFDEETAQKAILILKKIVYGVVSMSQSVKGLVQTSNNIGVVATYENEIKFTSALRSSVNSEKWQICNELKKLAEEAGAQFVEVGDYPAWEYKENSPLRDTLVKTYEKMFWSLPQIDAIHAGLECGIFSGKMPDCDMVSIGPNMTGVHTTEERVSISSVDKTYNYIIAILKNLK